MRSANTPTVLKMVRAPFFSSILAPLVAGTLLSIFIQGSFNPLGFVLVLILGIGLHTATNVYNDIYDTLQGSDKINVHRNEFSGGSGVLVDHPDLLPKMYWLARLGLAFAVGATTGLMLVVRKDFWLLLWALTLVSIFFSKYYTAAPVQLGYRGLGEVSVWFAFGPMAILVASVSQNVGFHPIVLVAMPATGISTLSILLIGQMIDLPADRATGKLGCVARLGIARVRYLYLAVQLILMLDVVVLVSAMGMTSWPVLSCLLPYAILMPAIWRKLHHDYKNPASLKTAAKINVLLHLLFSLLYSLGIGIALFL